MKLAQLCEKRLEFGLQTLWSASRRRRFCRVLLVLIRFSRVLPALSAGTRLRHLRLELRFTLGEVAIPGSNAGRADQLSELLFWIQGGPSCLPNHNHDCDGGESEDSSCKSIHADSSMKAGAELILDPALRRRSLESTRRRSRLSSVATVDPIPGAIKWFIEQHKWPGDLMYHYTSREALQNIVSTRKMWATDLRAMNDPGELLYGKEMIAQRVRHAIRRRPTPRKTIFLRLVQKQLLSVIVDGSSSFAISLSAHPDLPHQWRDYAKEGTGFALGWCIDSPCPGLPLRMWVAYDRPFQKRLIDGLIDLHVDWIETAVNEQGIKLPDAAVRAGLSLAMFLNAILHTFKDGRWESEDEFRYMFQVFKGYERPGQEILNRVVNEVQKSYIEADFGQVELRRVIIGPRNDVASTERWLRDILDRNGFRDTVIVNPMVSTDDLSELKPSEPTRKP